MHDWVKKQYGEEYPAAAMMDGFRLPLVKETRWSREYHSESAKFGAVMSRFMDGSATLSLAELERDWPQWGESERIDFCQSSGWLHKQSDFPNMLRFILKHGDCRDVSCIALSVAGELPLEEAFLELVRCLAMAKLGKTANFCQAIAHTKHPKAEAMLRNHLDRVWKERALWDDDSFLNWLAYDAMTCIEHLIELGARPVDFEQRVLALFKHPCEGNRDSCQRRLGKLYPSLLANDDPNEA